MARLVHLNGPPGIGKSTLSALYAYDDLLQVGRQRPGAVVVPSVVGAVQETHELLTDVLHEPVS